MKSWLTSFGSCDQFQPGNFWLLGLRSAHLSETCRGLGSGWMAKAIRKKAVRKTWRYAFKPKNSHTARCDSKSLSQFLLSQGPGEFQAWDRRICGSFEARREMQVPWNAQYQYHVHLHSLMGTLYFQTHHYFIREKLSVFLKWILSI